MNWLARVLSLSFVLFVAYSVPASSQAGTVDGARVETAGAITTPEGALAQASPAESPTGLPQRPAQPRTMRDYWHVFIAFAVTWLLLFGYTLSLGRRFGRLEDEVRRLRG